MRISLVIVAVLQVVSEMAGTNDSDEGFSDH